MVKYKQWPSWIFPRNDFHKNHKMALSAMGLCSDAQQGLTAENGETGFTFLILFGRFCASLLLQLCSLPVAQLWWVLGCKGGEGAGNESWAASGTALKGYNEIKSRGSWVRTQELYLPQCQIQRLSLCSQMNTRHIQTRSSCFSSRASDICLHESYLKDCLSLWRPSISTYNGKSKAKLL